MGVIIADTLIALLIITFLAILINGIEDYNEKNRLNKESFANTSGEMKFPIITFSNNNRLFNFLIDTGASYSVIDSAILDEFDYKVIEDAKGTTYGIDGNLVNVSYILANLKLGNNEFKEAFQVMRVPAFDNLKEKNNIIIVGILGSVFLDRYNFMVDFSDYNLVYPTPKKKKESSK